MHATPLFTPGAGAGPPLPVAARDKLRGGDDIGIEARMRSRLTLFPAKAGTHRTVASNFPSNRMAYQRSPARATGRWAPAFAGETIR